MSQADLKKMYPNLPEWFFFSPKKKRSYFANLNKNYTNRINKENRVLKASHSMNVKFNVKNIKIQSILLKKEFNKNLKITAEKTNKVQKNEPHTLKSLLKK